MSLEDLEEYVETHGTIRCEELAQVFDVRGKDVVFLLQGSLRVTLRPVSWIMGVPIEIQTPELFVCVPVSKD